MGKKLRANSILVKSLWVKNMGETRTGKKPVGEKCDKAAREKVCG